MFFRHLRAAWLFLRFMPYVEAADHEDYWTEDDASSLTKFFQSSTGQKLQTRLRNYMTRSAVNATQDPGNPVYYCGWSRGVAATLATIDSHKRKVAREERVSPEPGSAAELLETLRP